MNVICIDYINALKSVIDETKCDKIVRENWKYILGGGCAIILVWKAVAKIKQVSELQFSILLL